ncbi:hypothetical protein, partial [Phocaeicola sp.]|uniref:hypothetical protein n=1 Tax=Phocaeicola sp. TaxID=2773926 RepID=UPI003AB3CDBE
GGIVPRFLEFFKASGFRAAFDNVFFRICKLNTSLPVPSYMHKKKWHPIKLSTTSCVLLPF